MARLQKKSKSDAKLVAVSDRLTDEQMRAINIDLLTEFIVGEIYARGNNSDWLGYLDEIAEMMIQVVFNRQKKATTNDCYWYGSTVTQVLIKNYGYQFVSMNKSSTFHAEYIKGKYDNAKMRYRSYVESKYDKCLANADADGIVFFDTPDKRFGHYGLAYMYYEFTIATVRFFS